MIYTCTLNPSVDYIVQMDDIQLGSLNRSDQTYFYPGGKGINVSRVLHNLGLKSTAIGFLGGFTGKFIQDSLANENIKHDFIETSEPTRVNIKLKTKVETEINGHGSFISKENEVALLQKVGQLDERDFLVVAGSLPGSVSANFYEEVAKRCNERNVEFIFDTSGPALQSVLKYKPFLIKPNQHELGELFEVEINTIDEAIQFGRKALELGPKNVLVSLGAKGAVFVNEEEAFIAKIPSGEVKSTVGAGDSTVAGFLSSYIVHKDKRKAFQQGIAAGCATAFSMNLCKKEDVEELVSQICIEKRL